MLHDIQFYIFLFTTTIKLVFQLETIVSWIWYQHSFCILRIISRYCITVYFTYFFLPCETRYWRLFVCVIYLPFSASTKHSLQVIWYWSLKGIVLQIYIHILCWYLKGDNITNAQECLCFGVAGSLLPVQPFRLQM